MWVLSRRPGERLVLPALRVTLTVLEVRGDRVRLGIAAPADTPVHRLEVCHPAGQAGPAPPRRAELLPPTGQGTPGQGAAPRAGQGQGACGPHARLPGPRSLRSRPSR